MPLTRRFFLEILGVGSAAAVVAARSPRLPERPAPPLVLTVAEESQPTELVTDDDVPLLPSRPTKLESFLRARGIKPAHLARESGYSRQHLLYVRMGRLEPTPLCAISIVWAVRRIAREPVGISRVFDEAVVNATRRAQRAVLRKFHPFERRYVRRCFA